MTIGEEDRYRVDKLQHTYPFRVDIILHHHPFILDPFPITRQSLLVVYFGHPQVFLRFSVSYAHDSFQAENR